MLVICVVQTALYELPVVENSQHAALAVVYDGEEEHMKDLAVSLLSGDLSFVQR